MAYQNARSIKQTVDEVIDSLGAGHIRDIGIEADEWGPFCTQAGVDPASGPAIYRGVNIKPVPIGGITVAMDWPF